MRSQLHSAVHRDRRPVWEDLDTNDVTTWNTDPAHTDVQFSAKHMMVTTVRGKFAAVEGTITLDEENPAALDRHRSRSRSPRSTRASNSATRISARPTSSTPTPIRRPRSSSTSVEPKGGNDYRVSGDLTIRGTTRPATFDVEFLGLLPPAWTAPAAPASTPRAGSTARTSGLTWNVALETRRLAGRQGDQARDRPRGRGGGARRRRRRGSHRGLTAAVARRPGVTPPAGASSSPRLHPRRVARSIGSPPREDPPMPEFDVEALRARFPALAIEQDGMPVALFDGPGGTQVPDSVIEAVARYYRTSNANHDGPFLTSRRSDAMLEDAHAALADLLNAADPVRDQARREHDDPHDARRALDHRLAAAGRHDRRDGAGPRGERGPVAERRRGPRAHRSGPWTSAPTTSRSTSRPSTPSSTSRPKLVAFGWASNAVGHHQPGRGARPPGPRGGRADVRRRRPCRAAPADRRPGGGHRLPRLLGLQVLRPARRSAVRAARRRSTRCRRYKLRPADDRFETGTLNHEGIAGSLAAVEYIAEVGRRFGGAVRRGRSRA